MKIRQYKRALRKTTLKKLHDSAYPIYSKFSHTEIEQYDIFAKLPLHDIDRPK